MLRKILEDLSLFIWDHESICLEI